MRCRRYVIEVLVFVIICNMMAGEKIIEPLCTIFPVTEKKYDVNQFLNYCEYGDLDQEGQRLDETDKQDFDTWHNICRVPECIKGIAALHLWWFDLVMNQMKQMLIIELDSWNEEK